MSDATSPRVEIAVCAALILGSLVFIQETLGLPAGTFEPLGSAPVPQATAGLIILLCLVVIGGALRRLRQPEPAAGEADPVRPRRRDTVISALLTGLYALTIHYRIADFAILTTVYLTASIWLLSGLELRRLPWVLLVAAVMGFGSQLVFTRVFVVDLPGL